MAFFLVDFGPQIDPQGGAPEITFRTLFGSRSRLGAKMGPSPSQKLSKTLQESLGDRFDSNFCWFWNEFSLIGRYSATNQTNQPNKQTHQSTNQPINQ